MPPLARRSAGERVIARSNRLSDDLLVLEEQTFQACWKTFDSAVGAARSRYDSAWRGKTAKDVAGNAALLADLTRMHRLAVEACEVHVSDLASAVVERTLDAIADELAVCEETLPKRYAGVAAAAVALTGPAVMALTNARVQAYRDAAVDARTMFRLDAKKQMLLSSTRKEEQDRATLRLFRPEKNSLLGNSGLGIWWRATSRMNGASRDVSIRLCSQTRIAAMRSFNEIGALR